MRVRFAAADFCFVCEVVSTLGREWGYRDQVDDLTFDVYASVQVDEATQAREFATSFDLAKLFWHGLTLCQVMRAGRWPMNEVLCSWAREGAARAAWALSERRNLVDWIAQLEGPDGRGLLVDLTQVLASQRK